VSRTSIAGRSVQTSGDGLAHRVCELALQVFHNLPHDDPGRFTRRGGHHGVEREQVRHEVYIGLDRLEQLWLSQHLPKIEPIEGILLHDLDDRSRKILPDVPEPARDPGRGRSHSDAVLVLLLILRVVELRESLVHHLVIRGEGAAGALVVLTSSEHQPPASQAFVIRKG
jgi:hypothetical protein